MTTLEIATNLNSNETNVTISNIEELNKFIKFVGCPSNVYAWTVFGWMTVAEWCMSNKIEDLF